MIASLVHAGARVDRDENHVNKTISFIGIIINRFLLAIGIL
jgi:hypothetical protein